MELEPHSQFQPDLMPLREEPKSLEAPLPGAPDILPAIEASDAWLRRDRRVKLPACARRGVPEAWIVDANAKAAEAHRSPSDSGYSEALRRDPSDRLPLAAYAQIEIDLSKLFA